MPLEEDFPHIKTALAVEARIASGEEELIPADVVDRFIDGKPPPLRVWREFRHLARTDPARVSGVNRVRIVEIEAGRGTGSAHALRKLAEAPGVAVEDIIA